MQKPTYKIYIREPWANLIIQGKKSIETATFSLPKRFTNVPLYVQNELKQIVGVIVFSKDKKYKTAHEFNLDFKKHKVPKSSPFHFNNRIRTHGWIINKTQKITKFNGKPFKGQFRIQLAH